MGSDIFDSAEILDQDDHEVRVVGKSYLGGTDLRPYKFMAQCRCGWVSNDFGTRIAAEQEGDEHRMAIR